MRCQGHHKGSHIVKQSGKYDKQNDVCDGYQIKPEPEEPSGVPAETPPFQVHIQVPKEDGDSGGDSQSYMYTGGTCKCKSRETLKYVQHGNEGLATLDIPYTHDEIRVVLENRDSLSVGKRIDAPVCIEPVKAGMFQTDSAKMSAADFQNSIYDTASSTNVIGHSLQPVEEKPNYAYNQTGGASKTLSNERQNFERERPLDLKDIIKMINTDHNYDAFKNDQEQVKGEEHQDVITPPDASASGSSDASSLHNTECSGPQQAETLLVSECLQVKQESPDLVKADFTVKNQLHEQVTCTCAATASTEFQPKDSTKASKLNVVLRKAKSGTWKSSLVSRNHSEKDLGEELQTSSAINKPHDLERAQATDGDLEPWIGRNHTEGHSKNKCLADGSMPDKCTTVQTVQRLSTNGMHNQGNHSKKESIQTHHSNSRKEKLISQNSEKSMNNECEQCGRRFIDLAEFRRHILGHKGGYGYVCSSCSFFCAGEDNFRQHVREHAYILNTRCKMDNQDTESSSSVERLADIHMAEYVLLSCVVCGSFVCSSTSDLSEHMSFCKGKEVFACPDCRLTFPLEPVEKYHKHILLHAKRYSKLQSDSSNRTISGFCLLCKEKFCGFHEFHAHDCCGRDKTKFSCISCARCHNNFQGLLQHLNFQNHSEMITAKDVIHHGGYVCCCCSLFCVDKDQIALHMEAHEYIAKASCRMRPVKNESNGAKSVKSVKTPESEVHLAPAKFPATVRAEEEMSFNNDVNVDHRHVSEGSRETHSFDDALRGKAHSYNEEDNDLTKSAPSQRCLVCNAYDIRSLPEKAHNSHQHENSCTPLVYCIVCKTYLADLKGLLKHMKVCKGKNAAVCPNCIFMSLHRPNTCSHTGFSSQLERNSNKPEVSGCCLLCSEIFYKPANFREYKHSCDDTQKRFKCVSCGRSYKNFHSLVTHLKNQMASRVFDCPDCSKKFKTKSCMLIHNRTVHKEEKSFLCDTCGKSYSTTSALRNHKLIHSNDKPYVCSICNHAFRQKRDLEYHMMKHTGEKPFVCKLCGKRFRTSNQCRYHENNHTGKRPYKCPICEKAFAGCFNLYMHKTMHDNSKPKNIICHLCGKAFSHKVRLRAHMRYHRGDYKKYDFASRSQEKFLCDQCPYTTCCKSYFRSHLRSHSEERPFQCKICGKAFKWASGLYIHKRIHTQEKPYKCSVCLKEFTYSDSFKKHYRQHEEENSKRN